MRSVRVELGPRSYTVHAGPGALAEAAALLPEIPGCERVAIVSDANVDEAWGAVAEEAFRTVGSAGEVHRLVVHAGETSKSIEVAGRLLEDLARRRIRRGDLLVALGGGMVGDLAGFVASVYQRGMPLVQVPTSLLAQVDAAIGGKTAVNLSAGKNLTGTFYQPLAVLADTAVLATLPEREYRSGFGEVAKYGFSFEPDLLDLLEASGEAIAHRDPDFLGEIVGRSAAIKARVVSSDERDLDDRRIMLNYGHTLAHALEALGRYEEWLHGEAVSVGCVFAAALAREVGMLKDGDMERHRSVLSGLGLPVRARFDAEAVRRAWEMDKKYRGGIRWVLLCGLGDSVVMTGVGSREVASALAEVVGP